MNAAQRRISRRALAVSLPLGTKVSTPTGAAAVVVGHDAHRALVKLRNNAKKAFRPAALTLAA